MYFLTITETQSFKILNRLGFPDLISYSLMRLILLTKQ